MRAGIKRTLGQLKNAKLAPRTLVGKTGTFAELSQDALSKIKTARLPILGEDVEAIKKLDKGITSIAGVKRSWAEQIDSSVDVDFYKRAFKKFPQDPGLNQFQTKGPKSPIADTPVAPKPHMKDTTAVDTKTIEEAMAKLKGNGVTPPSSSAGERVSLSGSPQSVVQDTAQETISNPKRFAEQAKKISQGQASKLDSDGVSQGQKRMYNAVTKGAAASAMFIAGTGILDAMHTSVKNNSARRRNEEQLKEQEKKQREAREKNRKRNRRNANYNQSHTMGSIVFDMFNDRTGHHLMGNNRF